MKYKDKRKMICQTNQAFILIEQGNYRLAEKVLLSLLEEYPDNPNINYNIGLLYMCNHNYKAALSYLKKEIIILKLILD